MRVDLAYGESGMAIDVPDGATTVIRPRQLQAVPDERAALALALRSPDVGPPLHERVRAGQTVAISVCDGTRPQPRHLMVPALLEVLEPVVGLDRIVVLVATGTHRGNTASELEAMLGRDVLDAVRVVNHDARDDARLRWFGRLAGDVPVWLNHEWLDADVRITTGFVEPHFFAGFSGGPKLAAPGLAGLETVLALHDARRIGHPDATWGITVGNPVHDAVREIAEQTGVDFTFDVLLDRHHRIVQVFAGDLLATHAMACRAAKELAMAPVPHPFDVVVTTNSGFPLDQNLYQAVKGLAAGAAVVRPGGTIICAAECRDGFPDHGSYREVLAVAALAGGAAAGDRGSSAHGRRPVAGAGAGPHPVAGPGRHVHGRPDRARAGQRPHGPHRRCDRGGPRRAGTPRAGRDAVRAAGRPPDHPLRGRDMKQPRAGLPGLSEAPASA